MRNIVISVPNNNPKQVVYLPAIWGILKAHCDSIPALQREFAWLEPIILKGPPESLIKPYEGKAIDVLGLSCYSWNMKANLAIAKLVRERNTDCLILAGGPNLDYRNLDFFRSYPYIDAIVLKDGEIPFGMALQQLANSERDLRAIPGLILPPSAAERKLGQTYIQTGPPALPTDFSTSSWLSQRSHFEEIIAALRQENPSRPVSLPWEIDRGCPYHCSFCDWGSNTNSRVRTFPLDRLREEVMWFAENAVHGLFITVANFGSAARDEEILDYILESRKLTGFPKVFFFNYAKNNVSRVAAMSIKAFNAGIMDYHVLSVQSLDEEVLAAMGRSKIDKRQLIEVARVMSQQNIPCVAQLIFGGPQDSLEKFMRSLTGLMELNIHDEYVAYPFDVLANAPANSAEYRAKWSIRTVTRRGQVNRRDPEMHEAEESTIIVGTNSYDERQFVDMYVWGRLIIALHNSGLTQFIARYLRCKCDLAYYHFYNTVIQSLFVRTDAPLYELYKECHDHIAAFLGEGGQDRTESMALGDLPDFEYLLNVEEYVLCRLMQRIDQFYEHLQQILLSAYGEIPLLSSLMIYQRGIMIDPSYDRRIGRFLALEHDWPAYFSDELSSVGPAPLLLTITIRRTHSGSQKNYPLDWFEHSKEPSEILATWLRRVVGKHYQRVERSYFKGIGETSFRVTQQNRISHENEVALADQTA
jgi:putative methyltransferase